MTQYNETSRDRTASQLGVEAHGQSWVKVNAHVDSAIAELISVLNSIPGLETLQSCQGFDESPAYVYFYYGDWRSVCELLFGEILPRLEAAACNPTACVEVFNGSRPMAKLSLSAEALGKAATALKPIVKG